MRYWRLAGNHIHTRPLRYSAAIIIFLFLAAPAFPQYYLRGEIKDEHGTLLQNVRLLLHSSGYVYYSGNEGTFGIQMPAPLDSLTISTKDFETITVAVDTRKYQSIALRSMFAPPAATGNSLLSATKNLKMEDREGWTVGAETYNSLVENDFIQAAKFGETNFAINTDKASYSNVRRFLNMGIAPPPDAVRVEELLNYFNFDYTDPVKDSSFSLTTSLTECPWKQGNQLLFVHACAKKIDLDKVPPANLVFLIDISGSMDMPNRLPLLKSAFRLLVSNLREKDTVSIVVYGSTVGVWLPPTSGADKSKIIESVEELTPGGPTPGEAGIKAAYAIASDQFIRGGNNRVILATDGDFNVGERTEEELEKLIITHKRWGIYLTCLGVGMGNYKDSKLQVLAERGNGNFAYLDDGREAEKVLMHEFTQTMYAVADDAYMNVDFNPAMVKEYRLIGFENKLRAIADSTSQLQGGEVGSGHSLVAMFEIKPAGPNANGDRSLANIVLHYKRPGDSVERVSSFPCSSDLIAFPELPAGLRFASAIAMFGELLRKSRYLDQVSWSDITQIARESQNHDDFLQKEFITMVDKARKVCGKNRRKH